MSDATQTEIQSLTQKLLDSIMQGDWKTYEELCHPTLTAFEPEALGQQVEGLAFHRYYFDRGGVRGPSQTTMVAPQVRIMGDAAVISYVRLTQHLDQGAPVTRASEETRVWHRQGGRWWHVHFHRSKVG